MSASIDGEFSFVSNDNADIGVLHVDMDSVFLINDGQHRKAAIEAAMQEDESLGKETISIVSFRQVISTFAEESSTTQSVSEPVSPAAAHKGKESNAPINDRNFKYMFRKSISHHTKKPLFREKGGHKSYGRGAKCFHFR